MGDAGEATRSAVIVAVEAADRAVARHRLRLDAAAGWGVPAHVTVLYPFVPPGQLDDTVMAQLAAAVASVPPFDCVLRRCAWFGEDVLWLAPEPDHPFRALSAAVSQRFPDFPPYGGDYPDVVPHLTVGERRDGVTIEHLRAAEADVRGHLPVSFRVERVRLIAGRPAAFSWRTVREFPLGQERTG